MFSSKGAGSDLFANGSSAGGSTAGTAVDQDVLNNSVQYGGEVNGQKGVDFYSKEALSHMKDNGAVVASNQGALDTSLSNMRTPRGMQAAENSVLSGREAATRGEQGKVLDLSRDAAMGNAPSVADYTARLGMNKVASDATGAIGSAHGLSGMTGAQQGAAQVAGNNSSQVGYEAAQGRSGEIAAAIGTYGGQANQMRGQDLTRLGTSNQNNIFNADLNNKWQLGNANLAVSQANLGVAQQGVNQGWFDAAMSPEQIQFENDQNSAADRAQAETNRVGAEFASRNAQSDENRATWGQVAQAGLGATGSLAGGAAGAQAGNSAGSQLAGMGGSARSSSTTKYY